jgi:hypothetical protein
MPTNEEARGQHPGRHGTQERPRLTQPFPPQDQLAAELFDGHEAAEPLLRAAIGGQTLEDRRRAALALAVLDPDVPLVVVRR